MTLSDENSQKKLLLDMWDRNLISDEAVIEMCKEFPDIEILRQRREERERKRALRMAKAGPYFEADKAHEYMKIALGRGYVHPKDAGLDMQEETTPFQDQLKSVEKAKLNAGGVAAKGKSKGKSGQGRPKGSKDSGARKSKAFKVRTSAEQVDNFTDFMVKNIWAKETYSTLSEYVNPIMLRYFDKANLRELSVDEIAQTEKVKFAVLANLDPYSVIDAAQVKNLILSRCILPRQFKALYDELSSRAYEIHGREPSMEERKVIRSSVYALLK